jgi:hypothetical protein
MTKPARMRSRGLVGKPEKKKLHVRIIPERTFKKVNGGGAWHVFRIRASSEHSTCMFGLNKRHEIVGLARRLLASKATLWSRPCDRPIPSLSSPTVCLSGLHLGTIFEAEQTRRSNVWEISEVIMNSKQQNVDYIYNLRNKGRWLVYSSTEKVGDDILDTHMDLLFWASLPPRPPHFVTSERLSIVLHICKWWKKILI